MAIKQSKKELAYSQIKNSIINNELSFESPLTENYLCEQYGFSRTPVREALQQLASEGFITMIPDKGYFITQLKLEDFLQIYEMREALEGMGARLCSLRITEKNIEDLEHYFTKCRQSYENGDLKEAMQFDMLFHRYIMHTSKNTRMEAEFNHLLDLSSWMMFKANKTITLQSIQDHQAILNALKNSNSDLAEATMRQHISNSKKFHFNRYYLGEYQ